MPDPIKPEDVPAGLVALASEAFFARPTSDVDTAMRRMLAAVLTEVRGQAIRRGSRTEYRGQHIRTNLTGHEYEHLQAVAASQGKGMAAVLREAFLSAYPIPEGHDGGKDGG